MIRNISKIIIIVFVARLLIGCQEHNNSKLFEVSDEIIKTVENNQECLNIFKNGFGVDSLAVENYHYVEALIGRFIKRNKGIKYQSFVFIKLNESGEISTSTTFTIGKIKNGDAVITKYISKNNEIKEVRKVISDFSFDKFYEKLGEQAKESDRLDVNLLVIDFKNNKNSDCKLYNLSLSQGDDIKNLSFFNITH